MFDLFQDFQNTDITLSLSLLILWTGQGSRQPCMLHGSSKKINARSRKPTESSFERFPPKPLTSLSRKYALTEKFMQREVSGEYSPRGSSEVDLDFNDVFGDPPRRCSMQEVRVRYSFGETAPEAVEEDSDEERESQPWSLLKEKPVFGEETSTVARRRRHGGDFFDDIFRGGGPAVESPRSNPGSRIMSPSRPLPSPRADPFGTSLPAPFSLPAKMTKAVELPTFASRDYKTDGSPKGLNSPHSSSSLSRFSNQPIWGQDDNIRNNEFHPVYRHSPLSRQDSLNGEDSPPNFSSDQKDNYEKNFKKETVNVDSYDHNNNNNNQFHFSIYKWAGRGVPMLMPFVTSNISKSKDNVKYDKSASSNGRMESKLPTVEKEVYIVTETEPTRIEDVLIKEQIKKVKDYVEKAKARSRSSPDDSIVFYEAKQSVKEIDIGSDIREKIEPVKIKDSLRDEVKKPLHAYLGEEVEEPGNVTETKVKKTKTTKGVRAKAHDSKNVKKSDGLKNDSTHATVEKSSLQDEAINSRTMTGKSSVRGKVREFVQIFNQEVDCGTKADAQSRSLQSCRWPADQKENELSSNEAKAKEKDKVMHNADKISLKVDENLKNDEPRKYSLTKASNYTSDHSTVAKKPFSSETLHKDPNISVENSDDPLLDNFSVLELSEDHEKVTQNESSEDMKAIDAKVQQWSAGKKGNIHSLLSTLQFVLWPDSGWKPVPLVDIIEANSVKRAYQKALLRLHPDKLQQKGAAFHQKYTAEKVFDILQEAWDHFNTSTTFTM